MIAQIDITTVGVKQLTDIIQSFTVELVDNMHPGCFKPKGSYVLLDLVLFSVQP